MKKWLIVAMVIGWCGALHAEPLDLKQVCGKATWLVHLDVDSMRESSLVERAYVAGTQEFAEVNFLLSSACDEVGIDPTVDLHGVTAFGKRLGKLEGVAIIHANMKPSTMIDRAKVESGYQSAKYGKHEIHSWSDGSNSVSGAFFKPSVLVVARTEDEVHHALDVLDGKSPSLADKQSSFAPFQKKGAVMIGWAQGLGTSSLPFQSPAIKKSEAVSILVGEDKGQVFASFRLVAKTPDTAQKIVAVLRGAVALAELQCPENSCVINLSKRVDFSTKDKTASVDLHAPADEAWTYITEAYKVIKAKHGHKN
jgi:hypothetical protein